MSEQPGLLIDIWRKVAEMSEQMGAVVATTTATGKKVDDVDERLQRVETCVATIPALEGRVSALETKVKGNGNGSKAAPPAWEQVVKWVLLAVVVGAVLVLGYVELVAPALAGLK